MLNNPSLRYVETFTLWYIICTYIPWCLVNKRMCLSFSVVRKYAPIRWCALNREWNLVQHTISTVQALKHKASKLWTRRFLRTAVIIHGTIGSHCWQKIGKLAVIFGKTHFEVEVKSPTLFQQNIMMSSIATYSHAAGYLKDQTLALHSMDKSWLSGENYYRLYWVYALTRHYLTTGRKYMCLLKICA